MFMQVPRPDGGWPDKIGTYYPTGKYAGKLWSDTAADKARVWCAIRVLRIAAGQAEWEDEQARILLGTNCLYCGRELTDPASIERQIGPDCARTIADHAHQVKGAPLNAEEQEALAIRSGMPEDFDPEEYAHQQEVAEAREDQPIEDEADARLGNYPDPGYTDPAWDGGAEPAREGLRRIEPGMNPGGLLASMAAMNPISTKRSRGR